MDISENGCYLTVIRPTMKSTKHCVTGECEIQRVSSANDHESLCTHPIMIEYSIRHSKVLTNYKEKYPYTKPFSAEQAKMICQEKGIGDSEAKFYVTKVLRELHSFEFANYFLSKLKKTTYDRTNSRHQTMLNQLWKNLKPNEKLQTRITNQWISIGFQGNDPATDFRGAGLLGLLNLHRLSSSQLGKKLFKVAEQPKTEYFFCSAGLFLTMFGFDLLRQKNLGYIFWVSGSEEQTITQFQQLYQMLFWEFTRFWIEECEDKSIMQFNVNLKKFEKMIRGLGMETLKIKLQKVIQ